MLDILEGKVSDKLNSLFLRKNNNADPAVVNEIKASIGQKNSVYHTACIWSNGIQNAYTTNDTFLQDNLNWVTKATNWNRFMATATLGMIHQGNREKSMQVLSPYLHGGAASAEQ